MSAPTMQEVPAERRQEIEDSGAISPESRLLGAIFGYEVGPGGFLSYTRWDREHGVLFRVLVGRVWMPEATARRGCS